MAAHMAGLVYPYESGGETATLRPERGLGGGSSSADGASRGPTAGSAAAAGGSRSRRLAGRQRALLAIQAVIGKDSRTTCEPRSKFPYTAIGQVDTLWLISQVEMECTGSLLSSNTVLTAAHCVYDVTTGETATKLIFAPGAYRDAAKNTSVQPHGIFSVSDVHVADVYAASGSPTGDAALMTLSKRVPPALGSFKIAAECPKQAELPVRIIGYPADKPYGTCSVASCNVFYDCTPTGGETYHSCDTYEGMSGAPVLDSANRIRGVHHGTYELTPDVTVNSFASISKSLGGVLNKLVKEAGAPKSGG